MVNIKVGLQYRVAYHTLQLCRWLLAFVRIYCSMFSPARGGNVFIDVVGNNLPACMVSQPRRKQTIFIDAEILSAISVINILMFRYICKIAESEY
jgi:hypothetical protein